MISEFPLFMFTTLGGLAAGTYVLNACFSSVGRDVKRPWLFPLVCLVLLGIGLVGVLGHLGRPERVLLAMTNPASMITEEAYWSIAFGVCMLIDLVLLWRRGKSPYGVRILAGLAALGLIGVMANAYFTSFGNPAWATWQTLPLFIVGDLAMGSALLMLFDRAAQQKATFVVTAIVLSVLAAVSSGFVGVHVSSFGYDMIPFVVSVVLVVVGAIVELLTWKNKLPQKMGVPVAVTLVVVGVVIARYAFYAASVL